MVRILYYDITETKARNRIIKLIEYHGFERIQFSVFAGKIPPERWQKLWSEICLIYEKHAEPSDRIFSHIVERDHFKKMCTLGEEVDTDWILQEVGVLII